MPARLVDPRYQHFKLLVAEISTSGWRNFFFMVFGEVSIPLSMLVWVGQTQFEGAALGAPPPVSLAISCPTNVTVQCASTVPPAATDSAGFTAQGGTISGDCSAEVLISHSDATNHQTCPNRFAITRTYSVADLCGNVQVCDQTITVNDTTAPAASCPPDVMVHGDWAVPPPATNSASFLSQGGTISENCDGALLVTSTDATNHQTCPNRFFITRTYSVTDVCGNTVMCAQTITGNETNPAVNICPPAGLVSRAGDLSIVLHWDNNTEPNLAGYRVYRSPGSGGPFTLQNSNLLTSLGFCDLNVTNGQTNYYRITAVTTSSQESLPSATLAAVPHLFASDDEFLEYIQQVHFDYFWYLSNPTNGLVPDRTPAGSPCSIAAVGFGLTVLGIGIDHGWISRADGAARVLTTLNTFLQGPQGTNVSGVIGYNGWFYHFLDMNSAVRTWNCELSSIDTALLVAGIMYAKQYFDGTNNNETAIRNTADAIFNRINWHWMSRIYSAVAMGWLPDGSGFSSFGDWIGYNEAMILYCLGLGAGTNALPANAWFAWTSGYNWAGLYGQNYVYFPPLFGHQYSHCWIDFRHNADRYMTNRSSSYFENSRRATLAQRAYCIANPSHQVGYSSNLWGLTACDSPTGYAAHGAPPAQNDDGTIAPTAPGGSMPFAPEYCLPALRYIYTQLRTNIWTAYGFRDAFNLGVNWYDPDELGIDQGPIVIMIENYRTQRVWRLFMKNPEVQRGLQLAGFVSLPFVPVALQNLPDQSALNLYWDATPNRTYQVEYSPDLFSWFASPTGELKATNGPTLNWMDVGPPATVSARATMPYRFYRVFRFGPP